MLRRFIAELRHRRVLRVAGAYAVAGWGVLQAADWMAPLLELPGWTVPLIGLLVVLGLPLVLIVAWAFELTPDGIRRAPPSAPDELQLQAARPPWIELALLAAVIGVLAVSALQIRLGPTASVAEPARPGAAPSVAVLPFASFSDSTADRHFAAGLTEELINGLAQIPGLQVPGRTSSFYFLDRNEDLRDVGRQLGVAHLLEGSVRRSGERLRVTVQLVSAVDGFHLWSRTYDRRMDDAFAIQDDIASQVSDFLEATLMPGDAGQPGRATPPGALDGPAYASLLVGKGLLRDRGRDALTEARHRFEQILRDYPDQVDALSGFAEATIVLAGAYLTLDFESAAEQAVTAVQRALAQDPESVTASLAAGTVYGALLTRTEEQQYYTLATRALTRALDLAPQDPDALAAYASLLLYQRRWEPALDALHRALERDPLNRAARFDIAVAQQGLGRLGDAREELQRLIAADPDFVPAHLELGELLLTTGQWEDALPYLRRAHQARTSPRATFALANLYLNAGLPEQVRATLAELDYAPLSLPIATVILANMEQREQDAVVIAETQLAQTRDRLWRPMLVLSALNTGDLAKAREQLRLLEPALLAPHPQVAEVDPDTALLAGNLLSREGNREAAERVLEGALQQMAPPATGHDPIIGKVRRALALAQLGRNDAALAELEAARLQGYRTLWDFDHFLRLDRYPMCAGLRDDPRFRALIAEIDRENREVGERLRNI